MSLSNGAPSAATVVIHCVGLNSSALERRVTAVAATVPAEVELIATTSRWYRSTTAARGRVRLQPVADGGQGLVERAVRAGRLVVTVPPVLDLSAGWFEDVVARSTHSRSIGVLVCGSEGLFVFPPGIGSTAAPRKEWPSVAGVAAVAVAQPHRLQRTLAAVLIVKDEEEVLPECLSALRGVVDEIVVYDTGSTDQTVEIARSAGATVVKGYWDSDFAAARNRALSHATAEWVLSVDADEVLDCSRSELRDFINATSASSAMVRQVSTSWSGADSGFEVRVIRLFRRNSARWAGAIHEAVVPLDESTWSQDAHPAPLRLMHSGYRATSTDGKDKGARNATIALQSRDASAVGSPEWVIAQAHYARSLALGGHFDQAREAFAELSAFELPAWLVVPAARVAIHLLMEVNASREAVDTWIARSEAAGESSGQVALWRARLAMAEEDWWAATDLLAEFDSLDSDGGRDPWLQPFDVTTTMTALAEVDLQLGLPTEALKRMQSVLHGAPDRVDIPVLAQATLAAGFSLQDLVREAPRTFLDRSLRDVPQAAPTIALAWFSAMADEEPQDHRPVVAASVIAARTGVTPALEWSVRAREVGLSGVCALRMLAENPAAPAQARLLAWAVLFHGFGELDAAAGIMGLVDEVEESARQRVLDDLRLVAPHVVDITTTVAAQVP